MTPRTEWKLGLVIIGVIIGAIIGVLTTLPLTGIQGVVSIIILVYSILKMKEHFWDQKSPAEKYLEDVIMTKDELIRDLHIKLITAEQAALWRKRFQEQEQEQEQKDDTD